MPAWFKRSLLNLWRKPFRTGLIAVFLALVIGVFTVMATVNRLAAERFAELEGKLETLIDVRPIGSLALGGERSRPLPFAMEEEISALGADLRVDPYLIDREFGEDSTVFYVGVRPGAPLRAVGDLETMDRRLVAGRGIGANDTEARVDVLGLNIAGQEGIAPEDLDAGATVSIRLHHRPWVAVLADMIEGVVVANGLSGSPADHTRTMLWTAVEGGGLQAA